LEAKDGREAEQGIKGKDKAKVGDKHAREM